ncbi:hypothetical protein GH714_033296 [Hevea brasiliensis]|uniref:Amine oxidase domain-containing protein n=1 Tax=Hevea brasiliensis TaxID=3981 RepID=A0A6A6LRA9_HEVBR|nr:hypothetical protein GH714_033296 [Hevea brasiliensis]
MVLHERADRASVVVVGAGLAVLVAARQLVAMGFKVVVLEGRARPGGRVKARKIKGDEWWLQQMLVGVFLLESMGTRLEFLQGNWVYHVIRLAMIEEVKSVDVNLGTALEAFRHALKVAKDSQERMLLNWHLANLEYANASLMSNLSMAYWDRMIRMRWEVTLFYSWRSSSGPQAVCTRWGKDCFTYGSYSYAAVGSLGDDYDILAESIGDGRVFFAGEATNKQYPETMHGAFLSGMREAANILREAKMRSLALTSKLNNHTEECDDLTKLYDSPDLTFGTFSILFDPRSNDLDSLSLLRVKFQRPKLDSCSLCLYGLISRKQAIELSELDDDVKRMEMLYHNFQVRLVARKGLSDDGDSLIMHIKASRSSLSVGI